ncbi:MAG: transcription antitermination factor NusB [Planctomycetaceae bacterium]|jgi:N utilization substance protein B|nr:transcription antitermination factor NusB [Planctomycetaceae bacterium]
MTKINSPEDYPQGKSANRRLARTVVFQILYQEEFNAGSLQRDAAAYIKQELPKHEPLVQFAEMLLAGTVEKRQAIDAKLAEVAQHWTVERMNPTDRSILRLAVFEIIGTSAPKAVIINEAVELAKQFGTKDSAAFVNGILDKIENEPQVFRAASAR